MIDLDKFSVAAAQGHRIQIQQDENGVPTIHTAPQSFRGMVLAVLSYVPILKNFQAVVDYSEQLKIKNSESLAVFLHALSQKFGSKLTERTLTRLNVDLSGNTSLNGRVVTQIISDTQSMFGPHRATAMNASKLSGFRNLGNTCYANSALKLLIHSVGEARLVQQLEHVAQTSTDPRKKDAAEKFIAVIEASFTETKPLRHELAAFFSSLQKLDTFSHVDHQGQLIFPIVGTQNDAQEFLVKLLASFDLSEMGGYSMTLKETMTNGNEQRPPKGRLAYCHDTTVSGSTLTLQQIVDETHKAESREVRWDVNDQHNTKVINTKQWTVPDLSTLERFTLHINASEYDVNTGDLGKTLLTKADFAADVSLVVHDDKTNEKWAVTFEPREVIIQQGSGTSGHYYAYTKDGENSWVRHDDSSVRNCSGIRHKEQAKLISFSVKDKVLLPRETEPVYENATDNKAIDIDPPQRRG